MSKYADEGTIAHALADMALTQGKPAAAYIGRIIECTDVEHHELSPSSAKRWMTCPGSVALVAQTKAEQAGRTFSAEVTEEMAEDVQKYIDGVNAYTHGAEMVMSEHRVSIEHVTSVPGHGGTLDRGAVHLKLRQVQVHDLKFGRGVAVSPVENEQLMLYACGFLAEIADVVDLDKDIDEVLLVIHQPRIGNGAPKEWRTTVERLRRFATHAFERAKHTLATKLETSAALEHHLRPSEDACRFCPAKADCPKLRIFVAEKALAGMAPLNDGLPIPAAATPVVPVAAPVADDMEQLVEQYRWIEVIEGWCAAVAAKLEAKILGGAKHPDFKVVRGRAGNRQWRDEKEFLAKAKELEIPANKITKRVTLGVPDVEKALKVNPAAWAELSKLVTQADGKLTVAPASDPRAAVEINPTQGMEAVPAGSGEDLI